MSTRKSLINLAILVICLSILTAKLSGLGLPKDTPPILAAIIPHHLTAVDFINDLGQKLSRQEIKKITIIGPNHDEVGNRHFITNDKSISLPSIEFAPDLVDRDHACFAPRDILHNFLPHTEFSCVLISSRSDPDEINSLAKSLSGVVVASVDFSHYQTLQKANINDLTTRGYLETLKPDNFIGLGNSFLDSPKTIITLFKYLSLNSITRFTLVNHSNSALILNNHSLPSTTSYFEYIYY